MVALYGYLSWRPSTATGGRVDLQEVEAATLRLCREYRVNRLIFDRMQAEQLTANLSRAGIRTSEFVFSSAGANRLARSLFNALRDRALSLPDDEETRAEFIATRLVETGPGTVKLANPPGQHDDIVTAVGMIVADLTSRPAPGRAMITVPGGRRIGDRPSNPSRLELRAERVRRLQARRAGNALLVPRSANDPTAVRQ